MKQLVKKISVLEVFYLLVLAVLVYTNYVILTQTTKVNRLVISGNRTIPVLTNVDGYWYYRLLTYLYYNHTIPHRDPLRAYPKGVVYRYLLGPVSFNMQYLTLPLIPIYGSPWRAAVYAPAFYAALTMILVYLFVRRVTKKQLAALVAATLFAFTGIGVYRFSAGFYDHDIFCVMYLVILLWISYELLHETKLSRTPRSLAKIIVLALLFVFWYASFIDSSNTYRAYLMIIAMYLVLLPFSDIRISGKNIALLAILVLLSPIITAKYFYGRLTSYYTDFATLIFLFAVAYYLAVEKFKDIYSSKLKPKLMLEFSELYLIVFLILGAAVTWISLYGPLKSYVVVIKQVGIARTIAEWQPLIDWNLFFKAPLLAMHGMLVNLSHYYSAPGDSHGLMFWLALAAASAAFLIYLLEFVTRRLRFFDSNVGLIYYTLTTLSYFVLGIVVGVQGVRLLSLFPVAVSMALSLAFLVVDERKILSLLVEPLESLRPKDIALGLYSIAVIALFIWLYYSYASSCYALTSKAWFAAIDQTWYNAMRWIDANTPRSAAFDFWWDYGYWVQTLGHRPTLTDGGHAAAIKNFDYYNAYYVFLGNLSESSEFLKKFNASYLLISWQEIGKWGAISYNAEYFANTFLHHHVHLFSAILPCILYQKLNETNVFLCQVNPGTFLQVKVLGNLEHPSRVELEIPGELGSTVVPVRYYAVSASSGYRPTMIAYPANETAPVIFVLSGASFFQNSNLALGELQGLFYYSNVLGGYLIVSNYGLWDRLFDVDRVAHSTFVQLFLVGNQSSYYRCVYSCERYALPVWTANGFLGYSPVVKIWFVA